jgi:hypothetical protein
VINNLALNDIWKKNSDQNVFFSLKLISNIDIISNSDVYIHIMTSNGAISKYIFYQKENCTHYHNGSPMIRLLDKKQNSM